MSDFTQPSCADCYALRNPGRTPSRLVQRWPETCCYCGNPTKSGIYVRVDPKEVPYPTKDTG